MDPPRAPGVVGAVLAGGHSRRMGRDKAGVALPSSGETLGAHAAAMLTAVCDEVVVLGHGRGMPPGLARIPDALDDEGPAGGLLALVESGRAARYLVVAVDMPGVAPAHLQALLDALDAAPGARAACFVDGAGAGQGDGALQPLPLALDAGARAAVAEAVARGERSLRRIVASLRPSTIAAPDPAVLGNINAAADFDALPDGGSTSKPGR